MQYGRWREVDIRGVPEVADDWTKDPLVVELHAEVERHDHHRYEDVSERQRDDEVVGDDSEFSVTIGFKYLEKNSSLRFTCINNNLWM